MKNLHSSRAVCAKLFSTLSLSAAALALLGVQSAQAASQTWTGGSTVNGNWSTTANWNGAVPGATSGTTNTDVATFNSAIANTWGNSALNPVVIDSATQNIGGISFATAAGNYFIGSTGGNSLLLTSAGTIQILSTLTNNAVETINAPLVIEGAGGTYTFANNSANGTGGTAGTLNIGGQVSGGAAGATVLTLGGSNTNINTVSGAIVNGSATSLTVSKTGAGYWTLSGANTYTGGTTVSAGVLNVGSNTALGTGTLTMAGAVIGASVSGVTLANNISATSTTMYVGQEGTSDAVNNITFTGTYTPSTATRTIDTELSTGVLTFSGGVINIDPGTTTSSTLTINNQYAITPYGEAINISSTVQDFPSSTTGHGALTIGTNDAGALTVTLSGANTYTGNTSITSGVTVKVGSATALGASTNTATVASGAILDLNGTTMTNTNALTLNGTGNTSGILSNGALINSSATAGTYAGLITLGSASSISATNGNITISNPGTITGATFGLTLGGSNTTSNSIASVIGTTTGGLTVNGGTWALTGANTFTGAITLNNGTLNIGGGGATGSLASTGILTLAGGNLSNTRNNSFSQAFSGGTALTSGGSTVTAAAGDTINLGAITRTAGATLNIASTGSVITSSGTSGSVLGGYATFGGTNFAVANGAGAITGLTTYNQVLGAAGDMNTAHNDNLTTTTTATASSTINSLTISDATAAQSLALAANSLTFTAGGGLLYSGGSTFTISSTAGTGYVGAGTGEFIVNVSSGGTLTFSSPIIGSTTAGSLTTGGAGTVLLSGANTYTGATTVSSGTLQIGNGTAGAISNASGLTVATSGTVVFDMATGGAYAPTGLAIVDNGMIVGNEGTGVTNLIGVGNSTTENITGTGGFTQNGLGTTNMESKNTYTGPNYLNAGTVLIGGGQSSGGLGTGVVYLGAVGGSSASATLTSNNSAGNVVLTNSGFQVSSGGTRLYSAVARNLTYSPASGTGLFNLNGGATLTVQASGATNALGAAPITGTGNLIFENAANGNGIESSTGPVNMAGSITVAQIAGTGSNTATLSGSIGSNVTSVTLTDGGGSTNSLTLSGTNAYTGVSTVGAGANTLEFANENALYDDNPTNWTAANLVVQAGGTMAFEVGNTGGFTATDLQTLSALGTSSGGFENGSNFGIDTTGASFSYGNVIANTNSGSNVIGLTKLGANTLTLTAAETYTGPTTIAAGTLAIGAGSTGSLGSGTYAASILNNGTLSFNEGAANQTLSGSIGGTGALTQSGTGTLTLSAVNTLTGTTTVSSGTLDLQNSLALQNSTLTLSGTGALVFDSSVASNAFSIYSLGSNTNIALQNNAGTPAGITLTLGSFALGTQNLTYGGVLSGPAGGGGALTFLSGLNSANTNTSTLTLTGANTYTGPTTITGGTLNLGGGTANGSINGTTGGALVLGGNAFGGTLAYTVTGSPTQGFTSTTINSGQNSITTSTATQTLNLGAITDNTGGTVDFNPFAGSSITTSTTSNTNGILGGFATYGGRTTWAVAPASPGGAITGLASGSYTESGTAGTVAANYLNQNIDVNASETLAGAANPNSIRFNSATAYTLTLTGLNVLSSGGILDTPTASNGGTITGGAITGAPGGQLAISSAGAQVTIDSLIVDNGGATAVTESATVNGRSLGLYNNNNSFSGGLYVNGGGVNLNTPAGTALGTGNVYFGNQTYTGSAGGSIVFGTATNTVSTGLLVANNGSNTSNGTISGNSGGIWSLLGTGTQTFAGIIGNYAGTRVANLSLDSGTQIIGNTQLGSSQVIANGGTFQVGTGYWGNFSNADNNVALVLGGGTFDYYGNLAGTSSQVFNSGTLVGSGTTSVGASTVTATNNSGAGALVLLGAITRSTGSTVNLVLPTGLQTPANGITTSTLNTNGILGGYATVGGTDWASNATNLSGGNIIGLSSSTINSYTNDTWGAGLNTTVTTSSAPASGSTTNSLRFNAAGANTLTLAGTNVITSGGLLVTPNVGSNLTSISTGTLTGSSGGDLVIFQNNTNGGLTISSVIANNTSATGLTLSGPGLVTLSGTNTFTGGIYLNGGTLNAATTNIDGSSATNGITFNGGTLQASGAITTSKAITVGVNGGTIDLNGKAVTLNGNIGGVVGEGVGAGLYGGFASTGVGLLTINNSGTAATLQLGGTSSAYYGGLTINGNSTVQAGSSAGTGVFSTGYVTLGSGSGTPTLDLNGRSATVAGIIGSGTNGVVTNSSTTATLTLDGVASTSYSGKITGNLGLTLNLNNPTEALTLLNAGDSYTGATLLSSGTLILGNGSTATGAITASTITANTSLIINNPSAMVDSGFLAGTGTVLQEGAGPVTFNGFNTYTNNFSGTLTDNTVVNLGTSAMAATILLNGTNASPGTINYSGATGSLTGNITVTTGTTGVINNNGGGTLTLGTSTSTISKNGSILDLENLNGSQSFFNVAGHITGVNANSDLNVIGAIVTLSNTNTYNGPTSIYGSSLAPSNYDIITAGVAGALPSSSVVTLGDASEGAGIYTNILDLNGNSQTIAGLSSVNDANDSNYVVNGNYDYGNTTTPSLATLTIAPATGTKYTFAGVVGGAGSSNNLGVTVAGPGTQVFTGANTYTGPTLITGGKLFVNNTTGTGTGSGAVTVNSGGTLAGSGTITSSSAGVTVNSGGTLASGADQTANAYLNSGTGSVSGNGLTISSNLSSALVVNGGATLTFDLGSTTAGAGSGANNFGSPNTNSTFLNLTGTTVDQIFSNTTVADNIDLVDLTVGSPTVTLTLRYQNPYLLIQTDPSGGNLDADFANLVTTGGTGVNGYVLGVSNGMGGYTAFNLNAYNINGTQINSSINLQTMQLYLYNGDLEVVPEPGTWALMVGGLALLIVIQRRRNTRS